MKILAVIWQWILQVYLWVFPPKDTRRHVRIIEGDTPPEMITCRDFVLAREDGEDWAIAFLCPCGCTDRLELALLPEVKPNWTLEIDAEGHPTLHPSVWRKTACKSHFWVKEGQIIWCE